jgi:hypothetical protein
MSEQKCRIEARDFSQENYPRFRHLVSLHSKLIDEKIKR